MKTTTLYRPVNDIELNLIRLSNYEKFPPRLDQQPIFYPVQNLKYALELSQWNMHAYGSGYITRFKIKKDFISNFDLKCVGKDYHLEYWIPSEKLDEFNSNIVGKIELI